MSIYYEDNIKECGVAHNWHNTTIKDSIITERGTKVEIVERNKWGGLYCYMNNLIQSALIDEQIYHQALVHPCMLSVNERKRVMIVGGGEGATPREVLKWQDVEHVDMYEWDKDVVDLFKSKYPEWAEGAWNDPRLALHYDDIFEVITQPPDNKYDVIVIDLFEPDEDNILQWITMIQMLPKWIKENGSIVMYAGMRNIYMEEQPYERLIKMLECVPSLYKECIPYKVYIPSFSGESMFLLLKNSDMIALDFNTKRHESHMTEDIWRSYKTLNW